MSTVQTQTPSGGQQAAAAEPAINETQLKSLLESMLDKAEKERGIIEMTPDGIDFGNFGGLWRWACMVQRAEMHPKDIKTAEAICLCAIKGRSLGIPDPFEALWSIAIINGRPCIWGDLPLAICRTHKDWDESGFEEYFEVNGQRIKGTPTKWDDSVTFVAKTKRKGAKEQYVSTFSVADAKTAKLWMKKGGQGQETPWVTYPQRMLKFRARGFGLRDNFPDALKGIGIRELEDERPEPTVPPLPTGRQSLRNGNASTPAHEEEQLAQAPPIESYASDPPPQEEHPTQQVGETPAPENRSDDGDWQITANEIASDIKDAESAADLLKVRPRIEALQAPPDILDDLNAQFTARHAQVAPAPRAEPKEQPDSWNVPKRARK